MNRETKIIKTVGPGARGTDTHHEVNLRLGFDLVSNYFSELKTFRHLFYVGDVTA